jgi:hypothetical protein
MAVVLGSMADAESTAGRRVDDVMVVVAVESGVVDDGA